MGNRSCKLDTSHTLSSYTGLCHLNAAAVADHALIADLFVLAAVALPVLAWTKNPLAEQTVLLRL